MKVNNLVSTDVSGGVFATIGGSFNAILWFGVPLYGSRIKNMNDNSLRYPRSQVSHEVCIDKTRDHDGFYYVRMAWVSKDLSSASIYVAPVSSNLIEFSIGGYICIELDGSGSVFLQVSI